MKNQNLVCLILVLAIFFTISSAFAMPKSDNTIPVYITLKETGEEKLVMVSPMELKGLFASQAQVSIHPGAILFPLLAESVPMTKANLSWASGFDGSGVSICIIDSGIDFFHENLPEPAAIADFYGFIDGKNPSFPTNTVTNHTIKVSSNLNEKVTFWINWFGILYQENANNTQLTGNWTNNGFNTTDGNWTTYDYYNSSSGNGFSTLFVNYTKPANSTSITKWEIGFWNASAQKVAMNISSDCWSYNTSQLSFKVESSKQDSVWESRWYCQNGTDSWRLLRNVSGNSEEYSRVYEERVIWYFNSSDINRFDLTIFDSSDTPLNKTSFFEPFIHENLWWNSFILNNLSEGIYTLSVNNTYVNDTEDFYTIQWTTSADKKLIIPSDETAWGTGGHGTHVAGIIFSNNTTYKGVAPNATMLIAKTCAYSGFYKDVVCYTSKVAEALEWCEQQNASIISISLGSPAKFECNTTISGGSNYYGVDQEIDSLILNNILPVIAAGNSGSGSTTITSPGCARKALTVGNVDKTLTISSSSSRGPTNDTFPRIKPEIVAPGTSIFSTIPVNNFGYKDGTSMSAPHVAGIAALVKQAHPDWTAPMLKVALMNSANQSTLGQVDNTYGYGFVDALQATNFTYVFNQSIFNNSNVTYAFNLTSLEVIKITSYWEENSSAPHNMIYLELIAPDATVVSESDNPNNTAQQVFNETSDIGIWQVKIIGFNVSDSNQVYLASNHEPLKPTVILTTPTNISTVNNETITFEYTPIDYSNITSCTLFTNSTAEWEPSNSSNTINNGTANFLSFTQENQTEILWNVECENEGGLFSFAEENFTLTIDRTLPVAEIISPGAEAVYETTSADFNVSITNKTPSYIWWTIDGTEFPPVDLNGNTSYNSTINWNYSGQHSLVVFVNDSVGNIGTAELLFYSNNSLNFTAWTAEFADYANVSNVEVWSNNTEFTNNESAEINDYYNITFSTDSFNVSIQNIQANSTAWNKMFKVFESGTEVDEINLTITALGSTATKVFYASKVQEFSNHTGKLVTEKTNFTEIFYCLNTTSCSKIPVWGTAPCYTNTTDNITIWVPHFSAVVIGNDTTPPEITLVSPVNNSNYTHGTTIQDLKATINTTLDTTYCNYTIAGNVTINATSNSSYSKTNSSSYPNGSITYSWAIGPLKNGTYNITFNCRDNQSNWATPASSTFVINDTTLQDYVDVKVWPLVTSATFELMTAEKTNVSVNYGTTLARTLSTSVSTFSERHEINLTALVAGRLHYYNFTYCDYQGHCKSHSGASYNFTTNTETTPDTQQSSESEGGTTTASKISLAFGTVQANTPASVTLNNKLIAVKRVIFTLWETTDNVRMDIEYLGNNTSGKAAPDTVYQYFSITSWALSNKLRLLQVRFEVPNSWFTTNNLDPDTLMLYHYKNGIWVEEPVVRVATNPYLYDVNISSLSSFGISAKPFATENDSIIDDPVLTILEETPIEDICGDEICGETETCKTCPEDCGECKPFFNIKLPEIDFAKHWKLIVILAVLISVSGAIAYFFGIKHYHLKIKIEKPKGKPKKHLHELGIRKVDVSEVKHKKTEPLQKKLNFGFGRKKENSTKKHPAKK